MNALITGLICPVCEQFLSTYFKTRTTVCQNIRCSEYGKHYETPTIELKLSRKEAE